MNILITGAWNCTQKQLDKISALGHNLVFLQQEQDSLPVPSTWVEGVICNGLFLYHPIERFTNLRYIQLTSAGYDRVPMDYITKNEIAIYNAGGVYSIPMAEFALGAVLQLYKQSSFFGENQRNNCWKKHRGLLELYGKTICIIGCGSVGTECAKRFRAFGCRVLGIARQEKVNRNFDRIYAVNRLDSILPEAEVLLLALPLTEESHHLINSQRLHLLKKGAVLINIARGGLVDTEALTHWLKIKQGFAVLDVFEEEPLPKESLLWQLENTILTPHNSFVGEGNEQRLFDVIINNLGKE